MPNESQSYFCHLTNFGTMCGFIHKRFKRFMIEPFVAKFSVVTNHSKPKCHVKDCFAVSAVKVTMWAHIDVHVSVCAHMMTHEACMCIVELVCLASCDLNCSHCCFSLGVLTWSSLHLNVVQCTSHYFIIIILSLIWHFIIKKTVL